MLQLEEKLPSTTYENHVSELRNMLFGRFSRRNVRGQNRKGGRVDDQKVERINSEGKVAIAELREKYAEVM